jgi:hypothetical protein
MKRPLREWILILLWAGLACLMTLTAWNSD